MRSLPLPFLLPAALTLALAGCLPVDDKGDDTSPIGDSDSGGDGDTDSDTDTDTDSDSDSDSDGDSDTDTDTDADSDPNVDADEDGFTPADGDCDDGDAAVNPDATEVCDGADNDCDGDTDEGVGKTYYRDADEDGWGDEGESKTLCEPTTGWSARKGDCDDANDAIHPSAPEDCDGDDNDCDGEVDEGCSGTGDTGIAYVFWYGAGRVSKGTTWTGGEFGLATYDLSDGSSPCNALGDWYENGGDVAPDCPDCEWSFHLDVQDTTLVGDYCDQFASYYGWSDGMIDGIEYSWGWADAFDWYGDGSLYTTDTVLFYIDYKKYHGWYGFAFNYADYTYVYGDSSDFYFMKYAGGYYYFYR